MRALLPLWAVTLLVLLSAGSAQAGTAQDCPGPGSSVLGECDDVINVEAASKYAWAARNREGFGWIQMGLGGSLLAGSLALFAPAREGNRDASLGGIAMYMFGFTDLSLGVTLTARGGVNGRLAQRNLGIPTSGKGLRAPGWFFFWVSQAAALAVTVGAFSGELSDLDQELVTGVIALAGGSAMLSIAFFEMDSKYTGSLVNEALKTAAVRRPQGIQPTVALGPTRDGVAGRVSFVW